MKNNKGITLIALVITIIVLLILAGVTIATLTGENGILGKATTAKERTKQEEGKEAITLAIAEITMDLSEKGEKPTIDYVGDHIHEKLEIDKQNVTKNGEPTENVDVIYGDYEYEIDDKFKVTILGTVNERMIISYTYEKIDAEGIIHLTVKTGDENGIKRIIKPDNSVQEYNNKEKEVTLDYKVTQDGKYKFIAEGNNDSKRTKIITIQGLDYFSIDFNSNIDYLNVENAYAKSKETLSSEQSNIISNTSALVENATLCGATKQDTDNSWTLLGRSNNQVLNNYFLYNKYSQTTTYYEEGAWTSWVNCNAPGAGFVSNSGGYGNCSLNETTGDFTVSGRANYYYYPNGPQKPASYGCVWYHTLSTFSTGTPSTINVGKTVTRYKAYGTFGYPKCQSSTCTSVRKEKPVESSLLGEVISASGVYPDNGNYKTGNVTHWYKKTGNAKPYYLYKYKNEEIQTTYDVVNKTINTKQININEEQENVKILVDASNTDYKLSISKDNQNWTEIDNTVLNGETEIKLPEKWNTMYIKINRNNSIINKIEVKY